MKQYPARLPLLLGILFIAGCIPESDNDLPARSLHDDPRVVGEFYCTDEKGRRRDCQIAKLSTKGHYVVSDSGTHEETRFRLFQIGEGEFISTRFTDENGVDKGGYMFGRLTVSRTQLVVELFDQKWLIANPEAVPGTEISGKEFITTKLKATSEKLEKFFQVHSDSKTVFDVDNPLLLNRVMAAEAAENTNWTVVVLCSLCVLPLVVLGIRLAIGSRVGPQDC